MKAWCATLGGLLFASALTGCASMPGMGMFGASSPGEPEVEEIYVFRTTREQRLSGLTPACGDAPFDSNAEDRYRLWSTRMRAGDGLMVDAQDQSVGEFRACFGAITDSLALPMYAWGRVGSMQFTGTGECSVFKPQFPAEQLVSLRCFLDIGGLPPQYVGGLITANTLAVVPVGRTEAPNAVTGYTSTSIMTMRVWKSPAKL
jgi:hypothetical protein